MPSNRWVLAKLLERVPAGRLEVMLDPDVFRQLVLEFGSDWTWLEEHHEAGRTDGELLLALIDEHGPEALWQSLPPEIRARAKGAQGVLGTRRLSGALMLLVGATFGSMYAWGMLPELGEGLSLRLLLFAATAGTLSGAWMMKESTPAAGALGGLVACAGSVSCVGLLAPHVPPELRNRLVMMPAMLPGLGLGALVGWLVSRRSRRPRTF